MHHPERWIFDWFYKRHDMDKADNRFYRQTETERRAAELHEGCRMPMEQARELAASEASPDWYARGQDWGLADALTSGQDGDWTLDDIARAFAAGATASDAVNQHEQQRLRADLDDYLRHVIDMTKGEHYFDAVRENAAALLKRLPSVLGPNVVLSGARTGLDGA